jgi:hypothetical protein
MTTFAPETASLTLRRIHILDNGARLGGAIRAISGTTVVVEDSLFQGNQTIEPGGGNRTGAAIYCQGCQITLDRTTLTGNGDDLSGKIIEIDGDGQLYMLNSTVSGNPFGGAVRLSNGNALIKFSTLVNNGAQNFSFFSSDDSHVFEVGATILQNDTHDNCQSGSDQPTSLGHNVVGDSSCPFAETGDVLNAPAVLGTLSNNGGPTFTHAPQAGSPAINRVPPASCTGLDEGSPLLLDQRGEMRPFGPNCDSGSVEVSLLPVIDDGFEGL